MDRLSGRLRARNRSRGPLSPERRDALAALLPQLHDATRSTWLTVRWLLSIDEAEDVMRGASVEAALDFDPALGPFAPFVIFRVEAAIIDAARRAANKRRVELAVRSAMRRAYAEASDDLTDASARQRFYNVGIAAAVLALVHARHAEDAIADREAHARVAAALDAARAKLTPRARRLLDLYYAEEPRTLDDVAREMKISSATARNMHRATLAKLGAMLRARGVDRMPPGEGP